MQDMYRQNIMDHYHNPRNFGRLDNPDITYEEANPLCGDDIRLDLQVREGVIEDVRFSGRGCALSMAASSMFTEMVKGLSLEEARKIGKDEILAKLGIKVGASRLKCALLPLKAFRAGVYGPEDNPPDED